MQLLLKSVRCVQVISKQTITMQIYCQTINDNSLSPILYINVSIDNINSIKIKKKFYPVNSMAWSWGGNSLLLLIQDRKSFSASSAFSNSRGVPGSFFTSVHAYESLLCLWIIRAPIYIQWWLTQLKIIFFLKQDIHSNIYETKMNYLKITVLVINIDLIYLRPRAIWQPHSRGS